MPILFLRSPQPVWFALAVKFAPHMLQLAAPGPLKDWAVALQGWHGWAALRLEP